jgi:hypothetical protein
MERARAAGVLVNDVRMVNEQVKGGGGLYEHASATEVVRCTPAPDRTKYSIAPIHNNSPLVARAFGSGSPQRTSKSVSILGSFLLFINYFIERAFASLF